MKKKLLAGILSLAMVASLTACGSKNDATSSKTSTSAKSSTASVASTKSYASNMSASASQTAGSDFDKLVEAAKGTEVSFYGWGGDDKLNAWLDDYYAKRLKEKYDILQYHTQMPLLKYFYQH